MNKNEDKFDYRQYAAFINRETELKELKKFIDKEPSEILFLHGPKSSGKTVLLYKFLDQIEKEQKLDVKFLNLRKIFTEFSDNYNYKDFLSVFFDAADEDEKIDSEIEKKIRSGKVDPFKVMEKEFIQLKEKGIKSILIIDELQALDKIYMNNGRDRRLIIELFNFFVAMTKESHLEHIIIASSDGYFLNTVYNDSRLKKTSVFYKIDYLTKQDVMDWLLNLEKYSKIKDYTLTPEEAEKIWDTLGGSMWEIQHILTERFDNPIDDVLTLYKKKMRGIIAYYSQFDVNKKQILEVVNAKGTVHAEDFTNLPIEVPQLKELLRDMVANNILYFDPTEAVYYPQGKSYQWGIRLYLES